MNCNEARRMVTSYVKKELSDKELEQFLHHVEHCRDCMDELDTYYTVYQALDLLDSGQHHDYNFGNMLKEDLRASHRWLAWRKVCGVLLAALLLGTELLMGFSVYTGFEMKQGQQEYTLIQRAMLRLDRKEEERISEELSEGSQEVSEEKETAAENRAELPQTGPVIEKPAAPEISNPAGGSNAVPENPKRAEGSGAAAGQTDSAAENSVKSKKDRVATENPEQKLK